MAFINLRGVRLSERIADLAAQQNPGFNAQLEDCASRRFQAIRAPALVHASREKAIARVKHRLGRRGRLDRLKRFGVGWLGKEIHFPDLRAALFVRFEHEVSPIETIRYPDHHHCRQ